MAGSRLWGDTNWHNKQGVLRRSKADLNADIQCLVELVGSHTQVTPGFQQAKGDVLGGPDACGEGLAKQAPSLDQLSQGVGNLQ